MAKTSGFSLDEFLKGLETEKTAEEVEETPEVPEVEETPEVEEAPEVEARTKVAELEAEGQIMARAFYTELEKLGVADAVSSLNVETAKHPNEINHLSYGDIKLDQLAGPSGLLNQLQMAVRQGGGDLTFNFNPGQPQPRGTESENTIPADVLKMQDQQAAAAGQNKAAASKIIDNLYKKVFGEE